MPVPTTQAMPDEAPAQARPGAAGWSFVDEPPPSQQAGSAGWSFVDEPPPSAPPAAPPPLSPAARDLIAKADAANAPFKAQADQPGPWRSGYVAPPPAEPARPVDNPATLPTPSKQPGPWNDGYVAPPEPFVRVPQPAAPTGIITPEEYAAAHPTGPAFVANQRVIQPKAGPWAKEYGTPPATEPTFSEARTMAAQQVADAIDENFPFLVGPFRIHAGLMKSAAQMATDPVTAGVMAGTAGLSTLPSMLAVPVEAGLSAYFATQAGKAFLDRFPRVATLAYKGDWQGVAEEGGGALADAVMAYGAASHAVHNVKEIGGAFKRAGPVPGADRLSDWLDQKLSETFGMGPEAESIKVQRMVDLAKRPGTPEEGIAAKEWLDRHGIDPETYIRHAGPSGSTYSQTGDSDTGIILPRTPPGAPAPSRGNLLENQSAPPEQPSETASEPQQGTEPVPGTTLAVNYLAEDEQLGEPIYTVTDTQTGQVLHTGPEAEVQQFVAQHATVPNEQEYVKALANWTKAQTTAALQYQREHPGVSHEESLLAVEGQVGRKPDINDYQIPAEAEMPETPKPEKPPESPEITESETVTEHTPNPPTAAQPTTPESPETIAIQMQQLADGVRRVVMFPGGQGMPMPGNYPEHVKPFHDNHGNTYLYRDDLIMKSKISRAANNDELSTILGHANLGLGAPDKKILDMSPHLPQMVVVVRDAAGNEVQSIATNAEHLQNTMAAAQALMPPGGNVTQMPADQAAQILDERQGAAPTPTPTPEPTPPIGEPAPLEQPQEPGPTYAAAVQAARDISTPATPVVEPAETPAPQTARNGQRVTWSDKKGEHTGKIAQDNPDLSGPVYVLQDAEGGGAEQVTMVEGRKLRPVEQEQTNTAPAPQPESEAPAQGMLALMDAIYDKLKSGQSLGNVTELNKMAEQYLGGDRVSGKWTPKDAFDAMEGAVNKLLLERGPKLMKEDAVDGLKELRALMTRLTTQGTRTPDQIANQQFSTPPTEAYTAIKVANITPQDVMLESSAGNGGLAVFARAAGATVYVNEIAPQRLEMLKALGFENITNHDGELINVLLDHDIHPTVIVINPPFSASTLKSHEAKNSNKWGYNHVESALQRLQPGGRLVAILGGGKANEPTGGASFEGVKSGAWFREIGKRYNVRANVRVSGREYLKYGTSFATRIIVIDKDGPTDWSKKVAGNVDTLEEAYELLRPVADSRPVAQQHARTPKGSKKDQPGNNLAPAQPEGDQRPDRPETGQPGAADTGLGGVRGGSERPVRPDDGVQTTGGSDVVPSGEPDVRPGGRTEREPPDSGPGSAQHSPEQGPVAPAPPPGSKEAIIEAAKERIRKQKQAIADAAAAAATKSASPTPARQPAPSSAPQPKQPSAPSTPPAPRNALTDDAEAAAKRMRERRAKREQSSGSILGRPIDTTAPVPAVDPDDMTDLTTMGAEKMLAGALKYDDWSARMMNDLGDLIRGAADDSNVTPAQILKLVHEYAREVAQAFDVEPEETPADAAILPDPLDRLQLEKLLDDKTEEEDSSAYVTYRPTLKGNPHPGSIVETKTMSTVPLPTVTYRPALPANVDISNVQMEAVVIAGQQNEIVLPGGARASALIGDGTGVGKGRIAAAIAWDNWRQGRKRIIFVSKKIDLMQDFARDLTGIGAAKDLLNGVERTPTGIFKFKKDAQFKALVDWKGGVKIKHEGIIFATYHIINGIDGKGNRRQDQMTEWLRGDDNGDGAYIIFDESHLLKNAVAAQRGATSRVGVAVVHMLDHLPALRTVSLSATAATEVTNLGYLARLGLWGPGTSFPQGFAQFQNEVGSGRTAAMELIARELKAMGKYISRTLSFKGVTYDEYPHNINDDQKALFREAAAAWRRVRDAAADTIATTTKGGHQATAAFNNAFYQAQLRFFGVLITALKAPTAIKLANQALAAGKSVVITVINTGESAQNREKNKPRPEGDDEDEVPDYDFGPGEMLTNLIDQHYPTQQFMDDVDSNGNVIQVPMFTMDEAGRTIPVVNPQAIAEREALIEDIKRTLRMPQNPLDVLIDSLGGGEKVAEISGRKEKFNPDTGKFVSRGGPNTSRDDLNIVEMSNFQSGKKRVAVLTSAGDTGISLHSGTDAVNQQKRFHITLQPGWSADKVMQMLGRTHRSGEVHPPEYALIVSNLAGEKRFLSTISRRLGSLGALSKGQKDANVGSNVLEKSNLETAEGRAAVTAFYSGLLGPLREEEVPGTGLNGMQILTDLGVLKQMPDGSMNVRPVDMTNVTKLLNRLLALDPDIQNAVYDYFYDIFEANVQSAIERGTLDTGVKSIPGDEFHVKESRLISTDPVTGATTYYYPVEAKYRLQRVSPQDLEKRIESKVKDNPRFMRDGKGRVILAIDATPTVHADGSTDPAIRFVRPGNGRWSKVSLNDRNFHFKTIPDWAESVKKDNQEKLTAAESELKRYIDFDNEEREREKRTKVRAAESDLAFAERKLGEYQSIVPDRAETNPLILTGNTYSYRYDIGRLQGARFENSQWSIADTPSNRAWAQSHGMAVRGGNKAAIDSATLNARLQEADRDVQEARTALEAAKNIVPPDNPDSYWKKEADKARAKVAEAQAPLDEAAKVAADPEQWARETWEDQYESAPTHAIDNYHLIGGAVLRYWAAIRAASPGLDIYTTVDTGTGQRIVGVSVSASAINGLIARITGSAGAAIVTTSQLISDVLINGTQFMLEGGIRVKRGRVSRKQVIELVAPDENIQRTLRSMGVVKESGVSPILYVPSDAKLQKQVIDSILKSFPAIPETPTTPLGRPRAKLEADGPIWFSQLQKTVEAKMPAKASPAQVAAIVGNPQNGVKADELKWTGFREWLADQKGILTKPQVLDYLKTNGVEVKEVLHGGPINKHGVDVTQLSDGSWRVISQDGSASFGATRDEALSRFDDQQTGVQTPAPKFQKYTIPGGKDYGELLLTLPETTPQKPDVTAIGPVVRRLRELLAQVDDLGFDNAIQAMAAIRDHQDWQERWDVRDNPELQELGDKYRVMVQDHKNFERLEQPYRSSHWDEPNVLAHIRFATRKTPEGQKVFHIEEIQSDWHQQGRDKGYRPGGAGRAELQHQFEEAEAEHTRTADARSKALEDVKYPHVDVSSLGVSWLTPSEQQAWVVLRSAMRRDGNLPPAQMAKWQEYQDKNEAYAAAIKVAEDRARETAKEALVEAERVNDAAWDRRLALYEKLEKLDKGVPDAPFSKTWHELAFRRALRWAAENGFDRVTWTTGKQQAGRYDLSKQVNEVWWIPTGNLAHPWGTLEAYDKNDSRVIKKSISRDDLPDYVGKDVARKLLEATPVPVPNPSADDLPVYNDDGSRAQPDFVDAHILKGDDLQVGGHGMNEFYDQILPRYAAKLGAKWGAKVEDKQIKVGSSRQKEYTPFTPELTRAQVYQHMAADGPVLTPRQLDQISAIGGAMAEGDSFDAAMRQIDPTDDVIRLLGVSRQEVKSAQKTETVHSMDITPTMFESVTSGQPLFRPKLLDWREADTAQGQREMADAKFERLLSGQGHVYVNRPAMRVIERALEHWTDIAGQYHGVTISMMDARNIQIYVENIERRHAGSEKERAALERIATALEEAQSAEGIVTIVNAGPDVSAREIQRTRREEAFHRQQLLAAFGRLEAVDVNFLRANDLMDKAFMNTRAAYLKRGRRLSAQDIFFEVGAALADGQTDVTKLTHAQSIEALRLYLDHMIDRHGERAADLIDYVKPSIRKELGGEYGSTEGQIRKSNRYGTRSPARRAGPSGQKPLGSPFQRTPAGQSVQAAAPRDVGQGVDDRQEGRRGLSSRAGSAPAIDDLLRFLTQKRVPPLPKEETGKRHYDNLAVVKRLVLPGRNLQEVREANRKIYNAAIRAGSSMSQAGAIMHNALPQIKESLKGSGIDVTQLFSAYQESRLRAIQNRYVSWSEAVLDMDDDEIMKAVNAPFGDGQSTLLATLDLLDHHYADMNVSQSAQAMVSRGDWEGLRELAGEVFFDASEDVAHTMTPDAFDKIAAAIHNDTKVKAADRIYGHMVENEMAEAHALHEGVFAKDLGPLNRYFPLMTDAKNANRMTAGRRLPFRSPQNVNNKMAMGMASSGYITDLPTFAKHLSSSLRAAGKANLLKTIADEGWSVPEPANWNHLFEGPDGIVYQGVRQESRASRTVILNGKAIHTATSNIVMPAFLYEALSPILGQNKEVNPNFIRTAIDKINTIATKGPWELMYHGTGMLGMLYGNTPFLAGETGLQKVLSAPLLKYMQIRGGLALTDPSTPENAAKLIRIAKLGALPARANSVTYSKEVADTIGAEHVSRWNFAPLLYGPKGLDARARLMLYDMALASDPNMSDEDLGDFINQAGNYTPEFQGIIEKWLKATGIGPFATAGMTRLVNGFHAATGTGPKPKAGSRTAAIAQWWISGIVGAVGLYILSYRALTGKWPWDDPRFKMWKIPVGGSGKGPLDKYRHSVAGDLMWGKSDKVGYLNFGAVGAPLIERVTPNKAIEHWAHHGSGWQVASGIGADVLNSAGHPTLGPATRAAFVMVFGVQPYVTDMFDKQGKPGPQLLPSASGVQKRGFFGGAAPVFFPGEQPTKHPGTAAVIGAGRLRAGATQLSGLAAALGEESEILGDPDSTEGGIGFRSAALLTRTVVDLAFPGLIANSSNPYGAERYLMQQKKAMASLSLPEALKVYEAADPEQKQEIYRDVRDKVYAAKSKGPLPDNVSGLAKKYFGLRANLPATGVFGAPAPIQ